MRLKPVFSGCSSSLLVAALASLFVQPVLAGHTDVTFLSRPPQVVAGVLGTGDATYLRARPDCLAAATSEGMVFHDTYTVLNASDAPVRLDVRTQPPGGDGTAQCGENRDTVITVYDGVFDPAQSAQHCAAYNDDAHEPFLDFCSRVSNFEVPANGSVTVVVASYSGGQRFDYDLRFDGTIGPEVFGSGFEEETVQRRATAFVARPVSGQVTVDGVIAPIPPDSWIDSVIGADGSFAGKAQLAPITLSGTTEAGPMQTRFQWIDTGSGVGSAPANGAASLSFTGMSLRLQWVTLNGLPVNIGGECRFTPNVWSMAGNSSATHIDVSDAQFTIPPTSDACAGFQGPLNNLFSGTINSVDWSVTR